MSRDMVELCCENFTSQVWQVIYLIFNQQNINVHRWWLSIFSIEHWIGSRENLQEPPLFHGIYIYMYILFIVVYGKNYKKTLDLMVKTHGFRWGFSQQNLFLRGGLHRWQLLLQRRWHHADAASLGSEGVGELGVRPWVQRPWPEGIWPRSWLVKYGSDFLWDSSTNSLKPAI